MSFYRLGHSITPRLLPRFVQSHARGFTSHESRSGYKLDSNQGRIETGCALENNSYFNISEEIRDAVHYKKPVVALETTIYTHGWPYPENLDLAKNLESIVRSQGAIPATIGVLNGVAVVGMNDAQMLELMDPTSKAIKISRRDLAYAVSQKLSGGTTIASTMMLSRLANISVFATGGLGGVHRGGEITMDISADLTELGRSANPVAVVAGGCKGFLDIPKTLEYLETQGVVVATFADGRSQPVDFPAFWVRDSGIKSPLTISDEKAAAALFHAQLNLNTKSSVFFASPVSEEAGISMRAMEEMIDQALRLAEAAKVHGSANTPYVLDHLKKISQGRTVVANRALVEGNVARGANLAVELSRLVRAEQDSPIYQTHALPAVYESMKLSSAETQGSRAIDEKLDIIVAGCIAVDTIATFKPRTHSAAAAVNPKSQTSNPATISQSVGGVGFNIALAAKLTRSSPFILSALANDIPGSFAMSTLKAHELSVAGIYSPSANHSTSTSQYIAVNDANSDLHVGMADMALIESAGPAVLASALPYIAAAGSNSKLDLTPRWFVVDANWSAPVLHSFLAAARNAGLSTAFEPVSTAKAIRLFQLESQSHSKQSSITISDTTIDNGMQPQLTDLMTPNALELSALHGAAAESGLFQRQDWWQCIDAFGIPSSGLNTILKSVTTPELVDAGIPQQAIQLLPFVPTILTKLGAGGVLMVKLIPIGDELLESEEDTRYVVARTKTGRRGIGGLYIRLFPSVEVLQPNQVVNTNGAGDTFLGALVSGLVRSKGKGRVEKFVNFAQQASVLTLKSYESVNPALKTLIFGT